MVRVDYRNNKVNIISGTDQLQNKAQWPYFIVSQTLRQGEIYISPINFNRENGNIEVPHVPVIRFSTPIYDKIGQFRGIIVSNIYVANFLSRLTVNLGQIYLTNKEGFYLSHPDPSRTFGFELGTHYNIRHDFPTSLKVLKLSGSDSYVTVDKTRNEVVSLQKIHFDPLNPQHYWILIRTIPEDEALGAVNGLRLLMLGLALIITIIVIFLARGLANKFTRPIIRLQTVTRQISQTHLPQLVNALERMAKGDLTAKLDLPAHTVEVMSTDDEVGQLTCAFNEMSSNLSKSGVVFEQMIANLRQVIEDIVQVSQGLAVGHLRVTPKAEYRGDFVQIKNALETALSDLWQVIEDIVQVSQGLAEGRQHVTAKAEYRGDFVQIKNALETAATKLAEATRKNALQDWIKTGQTQLNEQMSGEQDIMTLAQNIITFLTTYLDAQIGVFYLLEEVEKEHKGNLSKSTRLKLVASYASMPLS